MGESVDCIVDGNGSMLSGGIRGEILVNSKLSGMPDVLVSLRNPSVVQNCSFHSCIRHRRFERDRALSFIPPDGEFCLLSYWIPDNTMALPFNFEAHINYHAEHGKLQLAASPKIAMAMANKQMLIDKFCVTVRLPSAVASATLTCQG